MHNAAGRADDEWASRRAILLSQPQMQSTFRHEENLEQGRVAMGRNFPIIKPTAHSNRLGMEVIDQLRRGIVAIEAIGRNGSQRGIHVRKIPELVLTVPSYLRSAD